MSASQGVETIPSNNYCFMLYILVNVVSVVNMFHTIHSTEELKQAISLQSGHFLKLFRKDLKISHTIEITIFSYLSFQI